ncbi:hypothetical protein PZB75_23435 [Streptomyces sp. AM 4-1-1]|uniref:hypothetical protein n=1 Tax=Streptomyces sp. AM 4-1-1 TaxID=3028710 RepID=UPI0023B97651|nr:hypothetical protein [Streptomyces sp. AM 4-1-1]WEH36048.1 hypothetical protein PZB75_23435 [Streptomyces sp. AM 4-1-1]
MNPTTPKTPTVTAADDDRENRTATEATTTPEAPEAQDRAASEPADAPDGSETADGSGPGAHAGTDADAESLDDEAAEDDPHTKESSWIGAGATAVVAAALGVVSLTGGWTSRVAAERETLLGQIHTGSGGSAAQQISEIYGDAWHTTAFVNGVFALVALLVGVFALVRPAFGAPSAHPQPGWIRAVALAGVVLGVIGVLLSVGMYFDLFVALPTVATPAAG